MTDYPAANFKFYAPQGVWGFKSHLPKNNHLGYFLNDKIPAIPKKKKTIPTINNHPPP